ncbi:MAG: PepSY domain-containing protein [Pseudomonadota bacterium]|nr:PepSY domain-containing protein [Pseudomonadota bacterium]
MKHSKKIISAWVLGLALAAGGVAVAAPQVIQHEAVAELARAKISLVRAIEIAEAHINGGRAASAELDVELGRAVFDVKVVARDNTVYEVEIDGSNGRVISSRIDRDD